MAKESGEKFSHSKMLFRTDEGLPITFRIRPSETKARLSDLIKYGGGLVTSKNSEENYIHLYIKGDEAIPNNAVKAQYIDDCVAQNQQLDIDQYRVPKDAPINKKTDHSSSPSTSVISTTSTVKGRAAYTEEEDEAILSEIAKNPNSYRGNKIWKKMEMMKITNHSWQSMRDRFGKKLESRLPGYIEKYKACVLKKYGFTSSESSAEDKGNESNGPRKQNKTAKNKNTNNNHVEEEVQEVDLVSDDSFDKSLREGAAEIEQVPTKSRTPCKEKPNTVESKQGNDSGGKQTTKLDSNQSHNQNNSSEKQSQSDKPRVTRSQHNQLPQETNDQIQCSRVTRSNQALSSPAKNSKLASKRKPVQSEGSETENIHNTRSKRKCESPKKLHPLMPNYSSQDTEGKDTGEESQSSPLRRKTRQAGHKKNFRKSSRRKKMMMMEDSSSSSDEEEHNEPASHKPQRLDRTAIDKIINERDKSDEEESVNSDDDDAETQVMEVQEVPDSLPDSQNDDHVEALDEDVEAIQGIMSKFEISAQMALHAVYINSGDIDATDHFIMTGQPPEDLALWMKDDNSKLDSSNPDDIRKLVRKFGQEEVAARQKYLDS
ncbi:uncharacterized protein [Amphiura filiformis]|uniref:uncharacterized protein n=1 Tax=Amphiura filiformis TaxID=82378 RepID=UPI003B2149ED